MSIRRGRPQDAKYIYQPADEYVSINDHDPDLEEIRIRLPKPPPYYLIDGYNLPPEEQYFRILDPPAKLTNLERKAKEVIKKRQSSNKNFVPKEYKLIQAFWDVFEEERDFGYDAISEYIKEVHWHRKHGYWFFNNGKPTYITGDYFDYLNYWTFPDVKENGGHPEYRDIDRVRYIFRQYAERTHESVYYDDNGVLHVDDKGMRVCFGTAEPKSRRAGITGQSIHQGWKTVSTGFGKYFTIVSMEGDNASKHYKKKLLPAFKAYPLWLIPIYTGGVGNSVSFDYQNNTMNELSLGSVMDFTDSSKEGKNDGDKLHYLLSDEEGKDTQASITERWNVNKQAMSLGGGSNIIGFSMHPTTVEEMDAGGLDYMRLCNQSRFYERGSGGQTVSGLFEMFVAAWKGTEGFIDKHGMSVVDTPTQQQIAGRPDAMFAKLNMGSKEYLQNQLDELLKVDTPEAMETYRSRKRKFPMQYSDCWLGSSGDIGFDMEIIDKRIAELRRSSKVRRGWLQWSGAFGGPVEFRDDPEGPFELSMLLNDHEHSQMVLEQVPDSLTGDWRNQYRPKNPYKFTASADPFEYRTSGEAKKADTRSRQSDGGIAVLWEKDDKIDGSENRRDWESERFVMSYRHSPSSLDAYCEDVLKTCIYFGAMLYLERNKTRVWEYFVDKGFSGYLMYEINRATGRPIGDKPGFATYAKVKNDLFSVTKDYIRFRGHKEQHLSYLMECKNINGMEQMNKYDRFVAHAGCLLGSKQTLYHIQREAAHSPNENALSEVIDFFNRLK